MIKIAGLALFGVFCLVSGVHGVAVDCGRRGEHVSCTITESFAYGLIEIEREAERVQSLGIWAGSKFDSFSSQPGPRSVATFVLESSSGPVPMTGSWVSGRKDTLDTRPVANEVRQFLEEPSRPALHATTGNQFGGLAWLGVAILLLALQMWRSSKTNGMPA